MKAQILPYLPEDHPLRRKSDTSAGMYKALAEHFQVYLGLTCGSSNGGIATNVEWETFLQRTFSQDVVPELNRIVDLLKLEACDGMALDGPEYAARAG